MKIKQKNQIGEKQADQSCIVKVVLTFVKEQ